MFFPRPPGPPVPPGSMAPGPVPPGVPGAPFAPYPPGPMAPYPPGPMAPAGAMEATMAAATMAAVAGGAAGAVPPAAAWGGLPYGGAPGYPMMAPGAPMAAPGQQAFQPVTQPVAMTANSPEMRFVERIQRDAGGYISFIPLFESVNLGGGMLRHHVTASATHCGKLAEVEAATKKMAAVSMPTMCIPVERLIDQDGFLRPLTLSCKLRSATKEIDLSQFSTSFSIADLRDANQGLRMVMKGRFTGVIINNVPQHEMAIWTIVPIEVDASRMPFSKLLKTVVLQLRAVNLPKVDKIGTIDPYVIMERDSQLSKGIFQIHRSKCFKKNQNPTWDAESIGNVLRLCQGKTDLVVTVKLYDKYFAGDRVVGMGTVTIGELLSGEEIALKLANEKHKGFNEKLNKLTSVLYLKMSLTDNVESVMATEIESAHRPPSRPMTHVMPAEPMHSLMQSQYLDKNQVGHELLQRENEMEDNELDGEEHGDHHQMG